MQPTYRRDDRRYSDHHYSSASTEGLLSSPNQESPSHFSFSRDSVFSRGSRESFFARDNSSTYLKSPPFRKHRKTDSSSSHRLSTTVSPKPKNKLLGVLQLWKWELVSLLVSILLFVTCIVLLREFQDRPISYWKAPISINAAVAIISTVFKGSLIIPISNGISQLKWLSFSKEPQDLLTMEVYDQASRGAWGSLLFLVKQFGDRRLSSLAALGAALGVVTLITDPFSQACVTVGSCQRSQPNVASISRFNNYSVAFHSPGGAGDYDLTTSMQLAVLTGLYSPPANSSQSMQSAVSCPTGNCTFTEEQGIAFDSLTMCSSCTDVTKKVVLKTETDPSSKESLPSVYMIDGYDDVSLSLPAPGSHNFSGQMVVFSSVPGVHGDDRNTQWPLDGWSSTSIMNTRGIALAQDPSKCHPDGQCDYEPQAFDCALRPCIKSFSANVHNGVYAEKEHATKYLHAVPDALLFQGVADRALFNRTWKPCVSAKDRTPTNNITVYQPLAQSDDKPSDTISTDKLPRMYYPQECVYHVGMGPSSGLPYYIGSILDKGTIQLLVGPGQVDGDVWLKTLWNGGSMSFGDVERFMNGLATSVGAEMRRNSIPNTGLALHDANNGTAQAVGDAFYTETCIIVRWRYLSFLALLLAVELVYFGLVMYYSYRNPWWCENWKSSALPLLAQAIHDKDGGGEMTSPYGHKRASSGGSNIILEDIDPATLARDVEVRLVEDQGQWKLLAR